MRLRRARGVRPHCGEVLLIGCEGAGKTLLCRQLERHCSSASTAAPLVDARTQPSVGVELVSLLHAGMHFSLREVGGVMQPVWHRYFEGCAAVILVADSSTMAATSSAGVEWYNLLASSLLMNKPLLLLLNKQDIPTAPSRAILQILLRLPQSNAPRRNIATLVGSARTGEGIPPLLEWIRIAMAHPTAPH